jgi:hypothetical protein
MSGSAAPLLRLAYRRVAFASLRDTSRRLAGTGHAFALLCYTGPCLCFASRRHAFALRGVALHYYAFAWLCRALLCYAFAWLCCALLCYAFASLRQETRRLCLAAQCYSPPCLCFAKHC